MTRQLQLLGRETFASLRIRNFRLFFGGQLISQVGNWMTLLAQTLLVLHLTDSGVAVGLLAAVQFGPVLLIGPWAGLIADRSDKRKLLLVVQSLAMVQSFVLAAWPSPARRCGRSTRWPSSAASPSPSTTRPDAPSWSRWCRSRTSPTRSA